MPSYIASLIVSILIHQSQNYFDSKVMNLDYYCFCQMDFLREAKASQLSYY